MKWLIILLFPINVMASDWTSADTYRESTWLALWIVDWGQTRTIAKSPKYYEKNIFLDKYPTVKEVNHYFARGALIHYGISKILSPKYRKVFQYISIAYEADAVYKNYKIGINLTF